MGALLCAPSSKLPFPASSLAVLCFKIGSHWLAPASSPCLSQAPSQWLQVCPTCLLVHRIHLPLELVCLLVLNALGAPPCPASSLWGPRLYSGYPLPCVWVSSASRCFSCVLSLSVEAEREWTLLCAVEKSSSQHCAERTSTRPVCAQLFPVCLLSHPSPHPKGRRQSTPPSQTLQSRGFLRVLLRSTLLGFPSQCFNLFAK